MKPFELSSRSVEELNEIFEKNASYITYVLASYLKNNITIQLSSLLSQFRDTKMHLAWHFSAHASFEVKIDSTFEGKREDLLDLIEGFNDVNPGIIDPEKYETSHGAPEALQLDFFNDILSYVIAMQHFYGDWKEFFIDNARIFDGGPYVMREDKILLKDGHYELM